MWLEDTPKPSMMRLWFDQHQRHHFSLADFEGDDIEEFEGHALIEEAEQPDEEDMSWLFPPKGPGEFKNLKKKKRGKKGKKGKKKKGKKKSKKN